jgi:hypothetical protein
VTDEPTPPTSSAAPSAPEATTTPGAPGVDPVDRALGSLDHLLDVLHDNVLRPIILGGRFVAFAFIAMALVITVVVALLVALTRFMNVYFYAGREWATYYTLALILTVAGMVIWRQRRPVRLREGA